MLKEFQQELPESVSVYRISDQPKVVELSVSTFLKELLMAILTVILVVVALLPLRVALVASSTLSKIVLTGKDKTDDMADALALVHAYLTAPEIAVSS